MEVLIGRRRILAAKDTIDAYREYCEQGEPLLTSIDWFLSKRVVWREIPVILLSRRGGSLTGVVMLYYSTAYGVPYGLARAGRRGDVSVIAPVADRCDVLETAAKFLVDRMFCHTVIFTVSNQMSPAVPGRWFKRDDPMRWFARDDAHRLSLAGGLDATMQRLSYKLRRNLRYYRRRATTGSDIRFVPELTMAQRREAVTTLSGKGRYAIALPQAREWDRALEKFPGAFAMGLQNARGDWLSYLVGWREPSATYIDWQLNNESDATATVMRSYLIEHETARGSPALVFVGGTSAIWQRACDPAVTSDLLVTGSGPVARLLRGALGKLRPNSDVAQLLDQRRSLQAGGKVQIRNDPETTEAVAEARR